MIFREATLDDLQDLLKLEQGLVEVERLFDSSIKSGKPKYYNLPDLILSSNAHVIVAEYLGTVIGTGYAQIRESKSAFEHENHSYLGFMYVDLRHRRKGINQKVMNILIEWSQSKGVHDFYLDVYFQNDSAIKAYQKLGFEPCLLEMKLNTQHFTDEK